MGQEARKKLLDEFLMKTQNLSLNLRKLFLKALLEILLMRLRVIGFLFLDSLSCDHLSLLVEDFQEERVFDLLLCLTHYKIDKRKRNEFSIFLELKFKDYKFDYFLIDKINTLN